DISLDLLERHSEDPELWNQVRNALTAAAAMTRNVLSYARGSAPEPQLVDLADLVRRTIGLLRTVMPPNIRVVLEADEQAPLARGVPCELEQVVLNLVLNACDAMPHGGELRLTVRADGGNAVQLEVADTGSGLGRDGATGDVLTPSTKPGRPNGGLGLG